MHFGEHLTIDGYGGKEELLNNKNLVKSCLKDIPEILEMHTLSEPIVLAAPDNGVKDPGGWSGFVVIAESHISLHTFPKRGFISADVYTCRNGLDIDMVKNFFKQTFELKDTETNFILRGIKYPSANIN
ncbi:MAG: S-adenosylmethionine decarboxylase family protein [Minisyncoccota bacterium]